MVEGGMEEPEKKKLPQFPVKRSGRIVKVNCVDGSKKKFEVTEGIDPHDGRKMRLKVRLV